MTVYSFCLPLCYRKGKDVSQKSASSPIKAANTAPNKRVTKTAAEMAFEKAHKERRLKQQKATYKSHKEKVAEFNDKLSKLSEHYDIPKVGPG